MPDQELTLESLLAAVEQRLRAVLPEAVQILRGPLGTATPQPPALLLEYAALAPGRDPGTGETALLCRLQARLLLQRDDADAEVLALQLASLIAVLLRAQTWDLPLEPAGFVQARPEASEAYRVWLLEWDQPLLLGTPEWPWEDQPPGSLLLGIEPQTGPGHEADYFAPEDLA
ncbi:hypothetical protein P3W55_16810 [Pseudomonas citronellolis]|jgi:hypothetical protein|uniref:Phage protein n=1 Tax=Pseudomonas citronellolis TaxID=53408 RepID=A0AAW6P7Z5_9PSED|nr:MULTISPECIES: hypothetical protein [Pseudomonas]KWR71273.1 hypothetical protein RN02_30830 [Pseudomonas sp. PI1]MDF3843376.1 hypothetical protein [Pseudomonas citronellolis]WBG64018.1 hypothetical protein ELR50_14525 [Pseudomonas citronellolis]